MIGLGTLINVAAIVVGGGIGLAGGKRLSSRAQQTLIRGMAVCVLFVAIGGVMEEMLVVVIVSCFKNNFDHHPSLINKQN